MSQLNRMELVALKRMEKSLSPLKRRLENFDSKIAALVEEKAAVQAQFDAMESVMNTYTGGIPYEQVLYPAILTDIPGTEVDVEAEVGMIEVPTGNGPGNWAQPLSEEESFTYPNQPEIQ